MIASFEWLLSIEFCLENAILVEVVDSSSFKSKPWEVKL